MSENILQTAKCIEKHLGGISTLKRERFNVAPVVVSAGYGVIPETYEFEFKNKEMRVVVSFMPNPDLIGTFVTDIHREGQAGVLNLFNWRENRGEDADFEPAILSRYCGSLEEKVKAFCAFLDKALQDPAIHKILRGEAWDSTPFDFGDYK